MMKLLLLVTIALLAAPAPADGKLNIAKKLGTNNVKALRGKLQTWPWEDALPDGVNYVRGGAASRGRKGGTRG